MQFNWVQQELYEIKQKRESTGNPFKNGQELYDYVITNVIQCSGFTGNLADFTSLQECNWIIGK